MTPSTVDRTTERSDRGSVLRILAGVSSAVLICLLVFNPVSNNDVWLQIKIGELIVKEGAIPQTLLFPFGPIADNAFQAHEWLASILVYLFERATNHDALIWLQGGIAIAQFVLCFILAMRVSGSLGAATGLAVMAMTTANFRNLLRPELYAVALMIGLLIVLDAYRTARRWPTLLWCVPISVLWANMHGSFILAPVMAALFAAGAALENLQPQLKSGGLRFAHPDWRSALGATLPWAGAAAAMLLGAMVNPEGYRLLAFPFTLHASKAVMSGIYEWLPTLSPLMLGTLGVRIFLGVACLVGLVVAALRRHLRWTDAVLLLAFTALAFDRNRFIVFFGFIALYVIAGLIARWPRRGAFEPWLLASVTLACAVGIAVTMLYGNAQGCRPYECRSDNMSVLMAEAVNRPEVSGNVLNSYELGAELIYRAWPRLRPSIDSRVDSYGDDYFHLHQYVLTHDAAMEEYAVASDVRYILLTWRDYEVVKERPILHAHWHRLVGDHKMVLLERNANADVAPLPDREKPVVPPEASAIQAPQAGR